MLKASFTNNNDKIRYNCPDSSNLARPFLQALPVITRKISVA